MTPVDLILWCVAILFAIMAAVCVLFTMASAAMYVCGLGLMLVAAVRGRR